MRDGNVRDRSRRIPFARHARSCLAKSTEKEEEEAEEEV